MAKIMTAEALLKESLAIGWKQIGYVLLMVALVVSAVASMGMIEPRGSPLTVAFPVMYSMGVALSFGYFGPKISQSSRDPIAPKYQKAIIEALDPTMRHELARIMRSSYLNGDVIRRDHVMDLLRKFEKDRIALKSEVLIGQLERDKSKGGGFKF